MFEFHFIYVTKTTEASQIKNIKNYVRSSKELKRHETSSKLNKYNEEFGPIC